MMGIATTRDVKAEIERQGYSLLRASDLRVSDVLWQSWLSLSIDYADLPADDCLPGGARYRYRRYGRFRFLPLTGELESLPHEDYSQSADINRKIAPLRDSTFDSEFLRALVRFDFAQFPVADARRQGDWEVRVHLIRVRADLSEQGQPAPAGIHRDDAAFVTVHLAELVNARGGEVSIYDDDRHLLTTFRLEQVLDSYFFNDMVLWRAAAPIAPAAPAHGAIRSILSFEYLPG